MASPDERYTKLEIKLRADGKPVYKSARPATVLTSPTDVTLYASETDRLDVIANNVYGSPEAWWRIAAANRLVNGGISIVPGSKLLIPKVF